MASIQVLALLLSVLTGAAVGQSADMTRLYRDLLYGSPYSTVVPPIRDSPLSVTIGFNPIYITPLDDSRVEVDGWLSLGWSDFRLRWDPQEYANVTELRLPQDQLWTPDIVPYNNLDVRGRSQERLLAVLSSSGDVMVFNKATFRLPCQVESGERACALKLGSWTYSGALLDLVPSSPSMDVSDFIARKDLTLTETYVRRDVMYYACCTEPYVSVLYSFTLTQPRGWFS